MCLTYLSISIYEWIKVCLRNKLAVEPPNIGINISRDL